jgi:DNA modification methylase
LINNQIIEDDVLAGTKIIPDGSVQCIIADPPYFRVLLGEAWDTSWKTEEDYLEWSVSWLRAVMPKLKQNGLLYVFGQPGKREHAWLHLCSRFANEMQFHDLLVWDRVVGYNDRKDSFTPQYENILVLRHVGCSDPFFNKDAVRVPYTESQIRTYSKDKRYVDREARQRHLEKGKYSTNILRYPSLKGSSREKVGHPSQKPLALIRDLILASSSVGDTVFDPFLGSGTTAVAAQQLRRNWLGIERSSEYVSMAEERIAADLRSAQCELQFTSEEPT